MARDDAPGVHRRTVLEASTAAGLAAVAGTAAASPGGAQPPDDAVLLVGVAPGVGDPEPVVAAHAPRDASVVRANETLGYAAVRLPDGDARDRFADRVAADPAVEYVEPNRTYRTLLEPDDPMYPDQYAPQTVDADDAWDVQFDASSALVAAVDTAVECGHEDLAGALRADEGHDFVYEDPDPCRGPTEGDYHATLVTGAAAAETDNATGVAGVGEPTLLAARAFSDAGLGTAADVADAVEYSADEGADVINLSLGGGYSDTVKRAVEYAYDKGSLPVAAAGNDGTPGVTYPAAYDECVAVAALDPDGSLADYSNYGDTVELCAPGTDVLTTTTADRGSYERASGTSMAAAVVAGVAGHAAARWDVSPGDLRRHLKATADDLGLPPDEQGCGRVNAHAAMATDPVDSGTCAGGGSCGSRSTTESVSDSLSGPGDSDCWYWRWEYATPCEAVVELDGPSDADFDLYLNVERDECPTTSDYEYAADGPSSDASLLVSDPDTATPLYVLVHAESGSGSYTLTVTEKAT